jgi:hypothetical protein
VGSGADWVLRQNVVGLALRALVMRMDDPEGDGGGAALVSGLGAVGGGDGCDPMAVDDAMADPTTATTTTSCSGVGSRSGSGTTTTSSSSGSSSSSSSSGSFLRNVEHLELRLLLRAADWRVPPWLAALPDLKVVRLPGLVGSVDELRTAVARALPGLAALARAGAREVRVEFSVQMAVELLAKGGGGGGGVAVVGGGVVGGLGGGWDEVPQDAPRAARAFLRDWGHLIAVVER